MFFFQQKRDDEATFLGTYEYGRYSKDGGGIRGGRWYCYLTLKGATKNGLQMDSGYRTEYEHLGDRGCWGKKYNGREYKEGFNPWCGTKGLCCRRNKIKNSNDAHPLCDPNKNGQGIAQSDMKHHHCVRTDGTT